MAEAEKQTMEEALRYFATRIPEEAPNTFSGQMCPQLVSCDEKAKTLIFSYETADWMRNPGGAVHGGVILCRSEAESRHLHSALLSPTGSGWTHDLCPRHRHPRGQEHGLCRRAGLAGRPGGQTLCHRHRRSLHCRRHRRRSYVRIFLQNGLHIAARFAF